MPTTRTGPDDPVPTAGTLLVGDVAEFDEDRGLGVVEFGAGRRLPFHCTAITDGSRRVEVGAVVAFLVAAGRLGRLEATTVRPLPGVVRPGSTLADGDTRSDRDRLAGERPEEPVGVDGEVQAGAAQTSVGPASPDLAPSAPEPSGSDPSGLSGTTPPLGIPPAVPSSEDPPAVASDPPVLPFPPDAPVASDPPVDGPDTPSEPDESPRPDFWSPIARSPSGPPPTWRTPVTPKAPPSSDDG